MSFKAFSSFIKVGRAGKFKTFTAGGRGVGINTGYYRSARFIDDISGLRHPIFSAMRGKRIISESLKTSLDVGAGLGDPVSMAITMIDDSRLLAKGLMELLDELYSQSDRFYFSTWKDKAKTISKSLMKIDPFKAILKGFIIERTVYHTFRKTKNRGGISLMADEISKAIGENMKAELEKQGVQFKEESKRRIEEGRPVPGFNSLVDPETGVKAGYFGVIK